MTLTTNETDTHCTHKISHAVNEDDMFKKKTTRLNALALLLQHDTPDIPHAEDESRRGLKALKAEGGVQELLAAQMLSVHQLQQFSMAMANKVDHLESKQYFTNAAIKLANAFVQQASLLAKLQGQGGQKITIEHVDVHQGGQAVVGVITGGTREKK